MLIVDFLCLLFSGGSVECFVFHVSCLPQKTLCGGIPGAVLEPLVRFWSHFVGIYRQKLTRSLEN